MKSALTQFIFSVFITFSVVVIAVSSASIFIEHGIIITIPLYKLGTNGLAFSTIFQIFFASVVIASTNVILNDERLMKQLSMTIRMWLTVICVYIAMTVMIYAFHWFDGAGWIGWTCYSVSYMLTVMITLSIFLRIKKKEAMEYNKCLTEFKERKK